MYKSLIEFLIWVEQVRLEPNTPQLGMRRLLNNWKELQQTHYNKDYEPCFHVGLIKPKHCWFIDVKHLLRLKRPVGDK